MTLHAFDFDGTLTTRDTLLLFIRHARGWWPLLWALLLYSPLLVLMKLRLADNGRVKERVFGHFFRGMREADFDALCQSFGSSHVGILRPKGLAAIRQALDQGDSVVVLSASIDRWVAACLSPFVNSRSQFSILGTQIEVADGCLTGRFASPNCYGPEKVRRLKERAGSEERIIAYGDSRGDKELLAYADESHYKPFR